MNVLTTQAMSRTAVRPLVGVPCCTRDMAGVPFQTVLEKYLIALAEHAGCDALLIPSTGDAVAEAQERLRPMLARLDGILLTGARSMVLPAFYDGPPGDPATLRDVGRDVTAIAAARIAVETGIPLLGICRGLQEICCAFGGTLDVNVSSRGGINHRGLRDVAYADRYRPAHWVRCVAGGHLEAMARSAGIDPYCKVNSLHVEGIRSVGPGLRAEAFCDDGLIEAASVREAVTFAIGVQWHPEWHVESSPINRALFAAFGRACAAGAARSDR